MTWRGLERGIREHFTGRRAEPTARRYVRPLGKVAAAIKMKLVGSVYKRAMLRALQRDLKRADVLAEEWCTPVELKKEAGK